ncbi:MFS transporter [Pararhizobium sp. IMCC21322]|uniref:MFS transporter n=1 Tax=Pararhizobium sp. IMCC21322 TaxID=3067903 RepID=UPI00274178E9|nr:MFS transporter [Pararhizobium sp. IMCC21322]
MFKQIIPISALILGSAFLMAAGGINGLILPLRGSAEGFSAFSLGMLGTGWAVGYVLGCILVPGIVTRVGHVRSFSVMAGVAVMSVLLSLLIIHPGAWIPLRALAGFSFAGGAMIVESWISERTDPSFRGRVFATYTMVNLAATTTGQLLLIIGDSSGYFFFVLAAIFYACSLFPTALSTTVAPQPLVRPKLDIKSLWLNSPIAVVAVFLVGLSNSSFGTLAAVYGQQIGLDVTSIALMVSLTILTGALFQLPVGWLSDRTDRRAVLIGLATVAGLADLFFLIMQPRDVTVILITAAIFGAMIFAMYPVIVAHANDHADKNSFLKISSGLLLVFGAGSILGPLIGGGMMALLGPDFLFAPTLLAHLIMAGFAAWRMRKRAAVEEEKKGNFVSSSTVRMNTPETAAMDPRTNEDYTPRS